MSEFDDCQAWEQCANQHYSSPQYYYHHDDHRNLFISKGDEGESRGYADDATWILTSSFVIFTMQSGFGLLEAGSCSPGFEVNIMMKNIVDVVFTALSYYLVGYGISFGTPSTPFMGKGQMPADGGYDEVGSGLLYSQYIFQLSFAATSTTIVSGCVAMRLRFFVYVLYSMVAVIFYSFVAHWIFSNDGWLNQMGVHDFAGGAPVHVFGGVNGLIATLFLGPRLGRFDGSRPISDFFPSSVSSQCLGMLALWWGWIGFNCGSSFGITDDRWVVAIRCSVTTINATVGGGLMSIIYTLWRTGGRLVIPEHLINGILGSLVAITPSCASVHTYDAFPIGIIGAAVGLGVNTIVCHCQVDDPVGAIGVHLGSGTWGMVSVGLFADSNLVGIDVMDGLFRGGGFKLLGLQLLAIVSTVGWALMWSTSFFYIVGVCLSCDWKNPRKGLRVDIEEEERGADWHLHGVIDQEAYLADLEKERLKSGDEDSMSSEEDDVFYEDRHGGRKQEYGRKPELFNKSDMYLNGHDEHGRKPELFNRTDMYMRTIFNGHFNDLATAQSAPHEDTEDGDNVFHDAEENLAEQAEDATDDTGENDDEMMVQIEEGEGEEEGEELMHMEDQRAKRKADSLARRRRRTFAIERSERGGFGNSMFIQGSNDPEDQNSKRELELKDQRCRRTFVLMERSERFGNQGSSDPGTIMARTRTPKRGLGLNGGLGHAVITDSALNEMDSEQRRRARRAPGNVTIAGQSPRNTGILGQSMISNQSNAVSDVSDRRSRMMRRAHRATGERQLQIYR